VKKKRGPDEKVVVITFAFTSAALLKVLLFRKTPERGGFWQPITGKLKKKEDRLEGAYREFQEESQLKPEGELIGPIHKYSFHYHGKTWKVTVYALKVAEETEPILCEEHDAFKWVTLKQALAMLQWHDNRRALKKFAQKVLGFSSAVAGNLSLRKPPRAAKREHKQRPPLAC
jgi:8-oxo-dGTP pyrophosphatase MutT (NUDIX family)